jgi:hypothetical protein
MAGQKLEHEVARVWREAGATLYDSYVEAASAFIEHADDLHAMFKFLGDEKVCQELRAVKSLINMQASNFRDQANQLRDEA